MGPVLEFVIVSIVWFLNTVDKFLRAVLNVELLKLDPKSALHRLTPDLREEARSPDIAKPLQLFLDGLGRETKLDFWRRFETTKLLQSTLENRIAIRNALDVNPDILKVPIKRPMFILGLPRSGTTHTFNLLSQDDDVTVPLFWQMMQPTPPGKPNNWRQDPRYLKAKRALNIFRALGHKHSDVAHVTRADGPEECALILRNSMCHGQHVLRLPALHDYSEWYYARSPEQDQHIYESYKRVLQVMAYGQDMSRKRYLLKAIWHCLGIEALHKVFPDACIVYNYRPIETVVPSACSMTLKTTSGWGEPDSKYGQRLVRSLKEYTNRVTKFLRKYDNKPQEENPVYILNYQDLISDPVGSVRNIYRHFHLEFTESSENHMLQYLEANPRNKHGTHRYSMEEYNLRREDILRDFEGYTSYMNKKIAAQNSM